MSWLDVLSGAIEQALGPQAIIYCLAAIGLNIHFGYTGLLNFGQAAFMMVGGYAVGALVQTWEQNLWLSMLVGLLAAVVLALVLGVPTLRLRADYLAIATIAAAEVIRQILGAASLNDQFGGQDGRFGFADSLKALNPIPQGGADFGFVVVAKLRLLHHDRRLDARAAALRSGLPADAESVGPRPQGHPRGRGRGPQPRQERLRLQDAGADPRRCDRCDGRHHVAASPPTTSHHPTSPPTRRSSSTPCS